MIKLLQSQAPTERNHLLEQSKLRVWTVSSLNPAPAQTYGSTIG